jgi:hypothetical protein
MDKNYTTFESGKEYTLGQIFSGENKIVIPDLQRDYCWGDKSWDKNKKQYTELVSGFVQSLLESFNAKSVKDKNVTLGVIYGYEHPRHHIQLCDGQQRVTTLYLLLGMLNRKTNNAFQKYLISDYELEKDDKEPYLQYAIRESTLYFLSDLVCEFFLHVDTPPFDKIKEQDWYFSEYDLDASIQSMIAAISTIHVELADLKEQECKDFGAYIIKNLELIYYDMGDRKRGEETFVIINTTGEPLTATENLKPILLGGLDSTKKEFPDKSGTPNQETKLEYHSRLWEDREEWFWQNRGNNNISDYGMKEFVRWIRIIEKMEDKQNPTIEQLEEYFEVVKYLFETKKDVFKFNRDWLAPPKNEGNTLIDLFKLLPVIAYVKQFGSNTAERQVLRIKRFFENLAKHTQVSRENKLIDFATDAMRSLPTDDIASIVEVKDVSSRILTEEEKKKFELYQKRTPDERIRLEDKFWKAEDHKIWNGEINPLINWATDNSGDFVETEFDKYNGVFNHIFSGDIQVPHNRLDLTRRALLTRNLKGYPKHNFCWDYSDWKSLIKENEKEFGVFLSEITDVDTSMEEMIKNNRNEKWAEFIEQKEFLEYCTLKNIQYWGDKGWILIKKTNATTYVSVKNYSLILYLIKNIHIDGWKNFDFYNEKKCACAFTDNKDKNIAIDIYHCENDLYQLQVFRRGEVEVQNYLADTASKFNLEWNGETQRYNSCKTTRNEIIELAKQIMTHFRSSNPIESQEIK